MASTYSTLQSNMRGDSRVHCHAIALADHAGEIWVQLHGTSEHNSLNPALRGTHGTSGPSVRIATETAAGFCEQHAIAHIDLLKVDVEGFGLAVFHGAAPLLAAGAVDYFVVEAGLILGNPRFTRLELIVETLRPTASGSSAFPNSLAIATLRSRNFATHSLPKKNTSRAAAHPLSDRRSPLSTPPARCSLSRV